MTSESSVPLILPAFTSNEAWLQWSLSSIIVLTEFKTKHPPEWQQPLKTCSLNSYVTSQILILYAF